MDISQVIIKPVVTEKSMTAKESGCYTFVVNKKANKPQIKKAIEDCFKVNVVSLETVIMKGKTRSTGRLRKKIKTSDFKKAMVKLRKDKKIEIF
jgi:large subunit ribosomal protein L23